MTFESQLLYSLVFASSLMSLLWAVQLRTKDAGIVDAAWSGSIGLLTLFFAFTTEGFFERKVLLAFIVGLWSFRLTYYILVDRVLTPNEDGRYLALREHWGEKANSNLFFFFLAQGLLAVLLSFNFKVLMGNPSASLTVFEYLGILLWIIGILGETLADRQLQSFRNNSLNSGKTCRVGLWRYSRHPNYFFEWLLWISYAVMGLGSPMFWFPIFIAALMFLFITKLTGIPYTEIQALKSRGEDYKLYQRTTNALIPWWPKEETNASAH